MSTEREQRAHAISVYRGLPQKPEYPEESGIWRRFVEWLMPWLRRKRELGDIFLEAEVRNRHAEALLKETEARVKLAEAEKIAAETAEIALRLDQQRNSTVEPVLGEVDGEPKQLDQELEDLLGKIDFLSAKYGLRIAIIEDDED